MRIELRKFNVIDYFRFLFLTLNRNYCREFHENTLGYIFRQIKSFFKREQVYKFAILVNNEFVGGVALYKDKQDYLLGCFVLKEYRSKGIATKASKEAVNFAFNKLKLKKIIALTDIDNKISQKILRRLGFKKIKEDKKEKEFIWEKRK